MDVPEFVAKSHNLIAIDVVYYAYLKQEKMNWFTKRDWLQVG